MHVLLQAYSQWSLSADVPFGVLEQYARGHRPITIITGGVDANHTL